jgi:demethylmenaquinone methyltransferase/2-methoxy-6-polyprenyl-1,4-benzoquinol methylase
MNQDKAKFFDGQVDAGWSASDYQGGDLEKITNLLDTVKIKPGQRVLEPGCGTGRLTQILSAAVGANGLVAALDISEVMIERCRQRTRALNNVLVERAALEEMDLKNNFFDLVLCFNVFPHLDDQPAALALFHRILKPTGLLAIFHLKPSSYINDIHSKSQTVVEHDLLPAAAELKAMLQRSGFSLLQYRDDDRYLALAGKNL